MLAFCCEKYRYYVSCWLQRWGLYLTLLICIHPWQVAKAQSPLPAFGFFYLQDIPTLFNAAAAPGESLFSTNLRYGSYSGPRNIIREMYVDGRIRFKPEDKISLGAFVYNQDQGPFIHYSRANLLGAYSVVKKSELEITASLNFGFANYSFEGNDFTAGGSALAPDASVAFYTKWKKWGGGVSFNHLIKGNLQPLTAVFSFDQNLQFTLQRKFEINYEIKWESMYNGGWYLLSDTYRSDWFNRFIYMSHYGLIIGLKNLDTYTLGLGGYDFKTKLGDFTANFTFSGYLRNKPPGLASNRYEIGISYVFKH